MKRNLKIVTFLVNFLFGILGIIIGIMMLREYGVFAEFPVEWVRVLRVERWTLIGIYIMSVFGLGNIVASVAFLKGKTVYVLMMSIVLFFSASLQMIILNEVLLISVQAIFISIIQLFLYLSTHFVEKKVDESVV